MTTTSGAKLATAGPRSRHRKGEGDQLRREILDATRDLLGEQGNMEMVSIRDIAGRVGVSPPSIYLHFQDKDHLFYAVCREVFENFAGRLVPVLTGEGNALERLRNLGREYIRWGLDNAALYPVLFLGSPPESIEFEEMEGDPGLVVLEGLVALVQGAIDEGLVSDERPAEAIAWAMWAGVHGTVLLLTAKMQWVQEHMDSAGRNVAMPEPEALIEAVVEGLFRGFSKSP